MSAAPICDAIIAAARAIEASVPGDHPCHLQVPLAVFNAMLRELSLTTMQYGCAEYADKIMSAVEIRLRGISVTPALPPNATTH